MENEMILKQPLEKLVPAMIEWNNEELMANVKAELVAYQNMTFDESNIADAKATKAKLNSAAKGLNAKRLEVGKVYLAPYDKFKSQVDEVIAEINKVSASINEVVDKYEEQRKIKKLVEIQHLFDSIFDGTSASAIVALDSIWNPKWYNATTKMSVIEKELLEFCDKVNGDLETIRTCNVTDANKLITYYIHSSFDLSVALRNYNEDKSLEEQLSKKINTVSAPVETIKDASFMGDTVFTVKLSITGTQDQLSALNTFLMKSGMTAEKIKEN